MHPFEKEARAFREGKAEEAARIPLEDERK